MDHLQAQPGLYAGGGLRAPAYQQVPGTDPKMLWHQEPQAQQIPGYFVGQYLTDLAFDGGRIGFLEAQFALRLMDLGCFQALRSALGWSWSIFIEFFFVGQSPG